MAKKNQADEKKSKDTKITNVTDCTIVPNDFINAFLLPLNELELKCLVILLQAQTFPNVDYSGLTINEIRHFFLSKTKRLLDEEKYSEKNIKQALNSLVLLGLVEKREIEDTKISCYYIKAIEKEIEEKEVKPAKEELVTAEEPSLPEGEEISIPEELPSQEPLLEIPEEEIEKELEAPIKEEKIIEEQDKQKEEIPEKEAKEMEEELIPEKEETPAEELKKDEDKEEPETKVTTTGDIKERLKTDLEASIEEEKEEKKEEEIEEVEEEKVEEEKEEMTEEQKGEATWKAVLEKSANILDTFTFQQWLAPSEYKGYKDGVHLIMVPSKKFYTWFEGEYKNILNEIINQIDLDFNYKFISEEEE